jgi:hypothetical protein
MKWLALVLLIINSAVWVASDFWAPDRSRIVASDQTLPRVSTLKVDAGQQAPQAETLIEAPEVLPDPEVVLPSAPAPVCIRLGWFETAENARKAYRSLGNPGTGLMIREQERVLEPLHWIIVPPQPEEQALRLFNDLQRRGIESYLVTRGENRNAISLGLFQSKAAAERVLAAKKRQNLNAVLANFPRNQLSYALVFEVTFEVTPSDGSNDGEGRLSDYRDDFEMVEIGRCEGIATTPENP